MTDPAARLLGLYDEQLRTDAETPSALEVTRHGPLRLVTFRGGRGFVTYRDLGGADGDSVRRMVADVVAHYRAIPGITRIEWKTRGHDHAPELHEALLENGFLPEETESIMVGEAHSLLTNTPLPAGVSLRQVFEEHEVRSLSAMQDEVFGDPLSDEMANALLVRLAMDDGMQLWVAEAGGQFVGGGRIEPVAGTDFAGIWAGAVLPRWRGQGIYRALTSARARSALEMGKSLVNSDSSALSRPILERSGLAAVSTTTPYLLRI